jgi:hypothetical protein
MDAADACLCLGLTRESVGAAAVCCALLCRAWIMKLGTPLFDDGDEEAMKLRATTTLFGFDLQLFEAVCMELSGLNKRESEMKLFEMKLFKKRGKAKWKSEG